MGKFYKIGFFVLIGLFIIAALGGIYYFGFNKGKVTTVLPTPAPTADVPSNEDVTVTIAPTSGNNVKNLETVKETIRAAIDTKNTQALEGYMADTVNVILEATECCGSKTKAEAIKNLDYLKDAQSPWNFDQTNETIKKLKATGPESYGPESAYIGIAANEYTVAFKFDSNNRINGIRMSATYKLVVQ